MNAESSLALKKIFPYFVLLMVPSIVGSGCFGGSSSGSAQVPALSASASSLALAVNSAGLSANLTGHPRKFTVTNTGGAAATSVAVSVSPALPSDSAMTTTCGSDLAPGASCTIIVTPGVTPSAAAGDTNPTPVTLTVAGTNTNMLSLSVEVLTYGSVHQAGYIFAIDDTTPNTGNIGGKVAALTDQAPAYPGGIIWSSNGNGANGGDAVFDDIPGIYESSSPPSSACNGSLEGVCNSQVIIAFYSPPTKNPAINRSYYAAGLCSATIGGFSDWYLPALCEMGYDNNGFNGCGTQGTPATQNMLSSLVENGVGNLLGAYWSSTEYSPLPGQDGWYENFQLSGGSNQNGVDKSFPLGVRCARAITN